MKTKTLVMPPDRPGGSKQKEIFIPKGVKLSVIQFVSTSDLKENPLSSDYFSELDGEDFEKLRDDIKKRGVLVPLICKQDLTLLAGHNRLKASLAIGLAKVPVQSVLGKLSKENEKLFIVKDNLLRRQLTGKQKKKLINELYGQEILGAKHGGKRGNQHEKSQSKSGKSQMRLAKKIEQEIGIKEKTASRYMTEIRKEQPKNKPKVKQPTNEKQSEKLNKLNATKQEIENKISQSKQECRDKILEIKEKYADKESKLVEKKKEVEKKIKLATKGGS